MSTVNGVRDLLSGGSSGELYTDRRQFFLTPYDIAELYKSEAPFITFMANLPAKNSPKDPEFKLFEHRSKVFDLDFFIGAAVDWNAGSYEGTKSNLAVELTAGGNDNVGFITKGDVIEVRAGSAGLRSKGSEVTATEQVAADQIVARLLVTNVDSQQQIDVENLSLTGSDTWNIVDQDKARIVTNAQPEGSRSPDAWSDNLTHVIGSCQIIKTPLELTGTLAKADLRGARDERTRLRREKAMEHKVKMENMYLRGYLMRADTADRSAMPASFTNPNAADKSSGKAWRMSWGIMPLLETYGTADYQLFNRSWASYDVDAFITDMERRQLYFPEGNNVEYAFAGSGVLAELSKTGPDSFFARSGGAISLTDWRLTRLGFQVRTLVHPFGEIHIARSSALRGAPWKNKMVIVDPQNVQRVIYRQSKYETGLADNDFDGYKDQYFSDEGLGVTLIEKHALWSFS